MKLFRRLTYIAVAPIIGATISVLCCALALAIGVFSTLAIATTPI